MTEENPQKEYEYMIATYYNHYKSPADYRYLSEEEKNINTSPYSYMDIIDHFDVEEQYLYPYTPRSYSDYLKEAIYNREVILNILNKKLVEAKIFEIQLVIRQLAENYLLEIAIEKVLYLIDISRTKEREEEEKRKEWEAGREREEREWNEEMLSEEDISF